MAPGLPGRQAVGMIPRPWLRVIAFSAALLPSLVSAAQHYLFVTFRGEQDPMAEQVHFGLSEDGLAWRALNDGRAPLISTLGAKGVRDPFILRSHDGAKTFIIATDLSIHLTRHDWNRAVTRGSKSIVVWESTDLVDWGEPRLVQVAPDDAGCTWAPEAVYDEESGDYLVFWASKTGRDDFRKHRIWAARTKDFREFGEPFIYIEKKRDIIDTTIIRHGNRYIRFSKDESTKATLMETSATLTGRWREVHSFTLKDLVGYEGPTCFPLTPASPGKDATWCLLLDHYSRGEGYKPFITRDLTRGKFEPADDIRFPFRFRHGSVLAISAAEAARLDRAFP